MWLLFFGLAAVVALVVLLFAALMNVMNSAPTYVCYGDTVLQGRCEELPSR